MLFRVYLSIVLCAVAYGGHHYEPEVVKIVHKIVPVPHPVPIPKPYPVHKIVPIPHVIKVPHPVPVPYRVPVVKKIPKIVHVPKVRSASQRQSKCAWKTERDYP